MKQQDTGNRARPGDHIIIDPRETLEVAPMGEFDHLYDPAE